MGNNQTPTGWVSIGSPELSSTSDNYYTAGSGWLNAPLPNSPVNGFSVFPVTREGSPLEGCQTTITGLIAGSSYNILYEYMWPKGFGLYASRFDIGLANQGYIEIDGVKTYVSIHSGNGGLVNTWYCGIKTFSANGPTATLKLGIDVSGSIDNSAIAWAIFGNTSSTINLGNDTTLCQGETLALDATTPNATYLWQDNSTNPTFNVNQQGTYWVQVTGNCISTTDTINVNYNPAPTINLGNDTTLCQGETLALDATTLNATYLWQDNSTNPTFNVNQQGTYWVEVTVNNCNSSDTIQVNYTPSPTINLGNDTTLCQGGTLALDATTLNATYLWQDNSTNPTFNVNQQGTYWVQVTVNNCNSSDTISINLKDCHCSLYIPNSFTPNSDNKNDHFSPIFDCDITEYNFTIFNRWGELLFETTNPTNSWNGTFKGKICQTGIFIYLLKYKDNKNTHQKKYGHVNLLK